MNVATFNQIKAVVGFNARFTQNVVGEDNLLAASAKVVAQVEAAVAGGAEAVVAAPVAEAAAPAAEVAAPAAEVAQPVVAEGAASVNTPSSSSSLSHSPRSMSVISARDPDVSKLDRVFPSLSFWRRLESLTCISCLDSWWLQCHQCG